MLAAIDGNFAGLMLVLLVMAVVIPIAIVSFIFWIWMLIDCLTSSLAPTEKLIWALVIVFLHVLGAILYFAIARGGTRSSTV